MLPIGARHGATLLVDEADNLGLDVNNNLRAVFNSGHRAGGSIWRMFKGTPKEFPTYGPVSIAAIGLLPLPLMQRSIIIHMEKTAGGRVERFDPGELKTTGRANVVYGFVARWAYGKPALNLDPDLPKELKNRVADNWRPLISIADTFGTAWGKIARDAAVVFAHSYHDEDIGVILLSNIRDIFDRMKSADLITALLDIEESGWSEYRGTRDDQQPKKLSQGEMARLLKPFGIRPKSVWPATVRRRKGTSGKGYYRSQFYDAWARYCDPSGPAGTPAQGTKLGPHLEAIEVEPSQVPGQ